MSGRAYHYTDRPHLEGILRSGLIEPRTGSASGDAYGVPAAVWFSTAEPWEPICSATMAIGPDGELPPGTVPGRPLEAARIGVPVELTRPWETGLLQRGAHWSVIWRLSQTGMEYNSSPGDWRVTPDPVAAGEWTSIELWNGARWAPLPQGGLIYTLQDLELLIPATVAGRMITGDAP
jgi:hypothetical protein